MNIKDQIWTEKYRPKNLDEFITDNDTKEKIREKIKEPLSMPNFIFVGRSPGTGKSSLAYVIKNEIGCKDFLVMNSSDERKIDTIRKRVKDYAISMRLNKDIPKIILMDEFDGMLAASQDALRFLMEKYVSNCKFILTANDESKIIDPIKSRAVIIRFKEIPKEAIRKRLCNICNKENVEFSEVITHEKREDCEFPAIDKIIDMYYPDMRAMINKLQELAPNISLERIKTPTELEDQFYNMVKEKKIYDARKFFIAKGLNPHDTLKYVLKRISLEDNVPNLSNIVWDIAEADYRMAVGADKEIQMFNLIIQIAGKLS